MQEYLISFTYDGEKFGFSIFATSYDEAIAKLLSLKSTAVIDGVCRETVEIDPDPWGIN